MRSLGRSAQNVSSDGRVVGIYRCTFVVLVLLCPNVAACSSTGPQVAAQAPTYAGEPSRSQSAGASEVTVDDLLSAPVPPLCNHPAGTLVDGELPVSDP